MTRRKTSSKRGQASLAQWIQKYEDLYPTYKHYSERVKQLLEQLLSAREVPYHTIEDRAKTVASFSEKLQRSGKSYQDPLTEIRDLAGLRIILYYKDDVLRVSDIIDKEFEVDTADSVDKLEMLAPDQFGYLSVHKVARLGKTRKAMTEWHKYGDLYAEIQIRTVLQHAWASISHRLQYKRETEVPKGIRRKLTRLAGLLELADEQFCEIQTAIQERKREISSRLRAKDATLSLDLDSLFTYLNWDPNLKTVWNAVLAAGFIPHPPEPWGVSQLLKVCELINISTVGELESSVSQVLNNLSEFFNALKTEFGGHMGGDLGHWTAVCIVGKDAGKMINMKDLPWTNLKYTESIFRAGSKAFGE
jgi:ppGpp synthetase/RelA/SpoT-type nucleotidyltranferase